MPPFPLGWNFKSFSFFEALQIPSLVSSSLLHKLDTVKLQYGKIGLQFSINKKMFEQAGAELGQAQLKL